MVGIYQINKKKYVELLLCDHHFVLSAAFILKHVIAILHEMRRLVQGQTAIQEQSPEPHSLIQLY